MKRRSLSRGADADALLERLALKAGRRAQRKKLGAAAAEAAPTSDEQAIDAVLRRAKAKEAMTVRRRRTEPWL
jgi:hypothetical protein